MKKLNIFIDTSVIFTDPFWKGNFSSQLLETARSKRINIFLSEVVLKELKYNFEKNLNKESNKLQSINSFLNKNLSSFKQIQFPDKKVCVANFNLFYKKLQRNGVIKVLKYKNEFLPEVLSRSISRKKPFSEKKTELKDALIWFTYVDYVKKNKLENCVLLTANCSDFCDQKKLKENIYKLHPELIKDSNQFQVFVSIRDFYKANSDWLEKPKREFMNWINAENINEQYVFDLLWDQSESDIHQQLQNHIAFIEPHKLIEDSHLILMGGYIEMGDIEWLKCNNIEIEIISDYAIISGVLLVSADIQGYGYNSVRDYSGEKFYLVDEVNIELDLLFSFKYSYDRELNNFEVNDVELLDEQMINHLKHF